MHLQEFWIWLIFFGIFDCISVERDEVFRSSEKYMTCEVVLSEGQENPLTSNGSSLLNTMLLLDNNDTLLNDRNRNLFYYFYANDLVE